MAVPEAAVCGYCADLIRSASRSAIAARKIDHHSNWGDLHLSSESCPLCKMISSSLRSGMEFEPWKSTAHAIDGQYQYPISVEIIAAREMETSGITWVFLQVSSVSTASPRQWTSEITLIMRNATDVESARSAWTGRDTSIDEAVTSIRTWFEACSNTSHRNSNHRTCIPSRYYPTRLITTGLDGAPSRLVQGCHSTGASVYATLSYRWGSTLSLRTTKATLSDFTREIPQGCIPKTIAQAIYLTRCLGIAHIWIDALCIVQDDPIEWQTEAVRMGDIYSGSQVTIAAAQSSGAEDGLFPDPGPHADSLRLGGDGAFFKVKLDSPDDEILVRCYRGDMREFPFHSRRNGLSTRGWVLQEQLLSTRVIYCMRPEMYWQCQFCMRTEAGIEVDTRNASHGERGGYSWYSGGLVGGDDTRAKETWRRIVQDYSARDLTFEADRGPAIAGIVRYFESETQQKCILGIWENTMARDLAWIRLGRGPAKRPYPSGPSLPSWSWLACRGHLVFAVSLWHFRGTDATLTEHAKLLNTTIQWQGTPYTSALLTAELQIIGPVREIDIVPFADGAKSSPPYFQVFGENLEMPVTASRVDDTMRIPWRAQGQFDAGVVDQGRTYICLLLYSYYHPRGIRQKDRNFRDVFLILDMAGEPDQDKYKRIGMACIDGSEPTFDFATKKTVTLI